MKKNFNKSLSWLLSVVVIFGIVSAVPVTTNATQTSSSFNQSYSLTGNSANDIVTVANAQMGRSGSSLGYSENWCADFVCDCAKYAGISDSVIPYNYWGSGNCTLLYNKMTEDCGAMPVSSAQAGDLIFWGQVDAFGHVGIVVSSTNAISGNNGKPYTISTVKNYRFDQAGEGLENWVVLRPNYSNNPVPPPPSNWESMPAGEKYYLKNNGTGTYMSVDSGEDVQGKNISVYQKTEHTGQQFEIRSSDIDKTYYLRPVLCESSGRVVNVYSDSSSNGKNVTIYDFTGHSTQQWKFRKVDGGYAICSANNTSTCIAESGTNVQLATYTGAANQIWTLENVVPPVPKGRVMSESEAAGRTIPDGDYYVVNGISPDYFLDISGNSFDIQNGTNLQMWTWGSSIPDREGYDCFHFEYLNNGFYKELLINKFSILRSNYIVPFA